MNAALVALSLALADPASPKEELLWPKGAPGAVGEPADDKPTVTHYPAPADRASGASVVVCPGGGYVARALGHGCKDIANWLNGQGISAFVLKYRRAPRYKHPAPLQDVSRAIRTVRARAGDLGLDAKKIGV